MPIKREKINIPLQHVSLGFHSDEACSYIQNLKLDDVNQSKITLVIGVHAPEAIIQQDIKNGGDWQSLLINTPLGWAIFGSNRNAELNKQNKAAVNTTLT